MVFLVISVISGFLVDYALVLSVVPSVAVLTVTGVYVILEISVWIGAYTFPGLAVPVGDKGNRLINVLIS